MERIVFVVNTEYHLLVTSSLLLEAYGDRSAYDVRIVEAAPTNSPRFRSVVDRSVLGVPYEQWEVDHTGRDLTGDLSEKVSALLGRGVDTLVVFHDDHPLNVYLSSRVSKRGGTVCLAPDGMKPYYSLDFGALRNAAHVVSKTAQTYTALFKNGLTPTFAYRKRFGYGSNPDVDELWLRYPENVVSTRGKRLRHIDVFQKEETVRTVASMFGSARLAESMDGLVLYVNNILSNEEAYEEEVRVIDQLTGRFGGTVYIKLHPNTPEHQVRAFERLGATLVRTSVPAELYILSLTNSVVVSGWSASLLMGNPSCNFYWLHGYFERMGCMYEHIHMANPTDHIREVSHLEEIEMPGSAGQDVPEHETSQQR